MSQPFKLRYQNEIVGIFVLGGVAVIFVVLAFMARSRQWFEETFTCQVRFDSGNVALVNAPGDAFPGAGSEILVRGSLEHEVFAVGGVPQQGRDRCVETSYAHGSPSFMKDL